MITQDPTTLLIHHGGMIVDHFDFDHPTYSEILESQIHTSVVCFAFLKHLRLYIPVAHVTDYHSTSSLPFSEFLTETLSLNMKFHVNGYVILVSEITLALGFVCIFVSHLP